MGESGKQHKVLLIGDLHVPTRVVDLPASFKRLLVPGRMQTVICTGNTSSKPMTQMLRSLAPTFKAVRGDQDADASLPETEVVTIEGWRIGVCHGHQIIPWGDIEALASLQRRLDVDILVTGHTHQRQVVRYEGKYFLNPGSATGAFSLTQPKPTPSFMVLTLDKDQAQLFTYEEGKSPQVSELARRGEGEQGAAAAGGEE